MAPPGAGAYTQSMIPISILDLCPIIEGGDAALALRNARDLAQQPDEIMFAAQIFDHRARRRSFEITAECAFQLSSA